MTFIQAVVLGIVQGLTEFLPISSDGHLALTYKLFGMTPDLTYEVFLHAATLIAMFVYFWSDVTRLSSSLLPRNRERAGDRRLVLLIVIATIISGVVALALEPVVEPMAANMVWVGIWFLVTALVLALGELLAKRRASITETSALPPQRAAFVGLFQGLAVLPGLSRSGSTIAAGMLSGLSREKAARFSFLAGMPIITVAALKDLVDLVGGATSLPPWPVALSGFAAAGIAGYLAIFGLLRFVRGHRLYGFAIYTAVLGVILIVSTLVSGG